MVTAFACRVMLSAICFVWIECDIVMFCPGKTLCMYFFAALVLVCVDCMVRRLCCCCCSPSETYGRKWGASNFQILTELPVPPQAAGVFGTFQCALYIYIILCTTVSYFGPYGFFLHYPFFVYISNFFACTLCMCVMYLTSI